MKHTRALLFSLSVFSFVFLVYISLRVVECVCDGAGSLMWPHIWNFLDRYGWLNIICKAVYMSSYNIWHTMITVIDRPSVCSYVCMLTMDHVMVCLFRTIVRTRIRNPDPGVASCWYVRQVIRSTLWARKEGIIVVIVFHEMRWVQWVGGTV